MQYGSEEFKSATRKSLPSTILNHNIFFFFVFVSFSVKFFSLLFNWIFFSSFSTFFINVCNIFNSISISSILELTRILRCSIKVAVSILLRLMTAVMPRGSTIGKSVTCNTFVAPSWYVSTRKVVLIFSWFLFFLLNFLNFLESTFSTVDPLNTYIFSWTSISSNAYNLQVSLEVLNWFSIENGLASNGDVPFELFVSFRPPIANCFILPNVVPPKSKTLPTAPVTAPTAPWINIPLILLSSTLLVWLVEPLSYKGVVSIHNNFFSKGSSQL